MLLEFHGEIGHPLEVHSLGHRRVFLGVARGAGVDLAGIGGGLIPVVDAVHQVVRNGQLGGQFEALMGGGEQRKQVQLRRTAHLIDMNLVKTKHLGRGLNEVGARHTGSKLIVAVRRILVIHGIGRVVVQDGIEAHGIVLPDDARRNVGRKGQQTAFGGMTHGRTAAILPPVGAKVYTVGVTVVGRHPVIGPGVAAGDGQGMHVGQARTRGFLEPVRRSAEVRQRIRRTAVGPVLVCRQHQEFPFGLIEGEGSIVLGMDRSVTRTLLQVHQDDAVSAPGTVNGRSRTVLEDVDGLDVGGIDVGHVASGHPVNHVERACAGLPGGDAADLDVGLVVGIADGAVVHIHAGHLALEEHPGVQRGDVVEVFGRHMGNGGSHLLAGQAAITDDHDFIQRGHGRFQHDADILLALEAKHLVLKADGREDNILSLFHGERKLAVQVRDGSFRRTGHGDGSSDDGLAVTVHHDAAETVLRQRDKRQQQKGQKREAAEKTALHIKVD